MFDNVIPIPSYKLKLDGVRNGFKMHILSQARCLKADNGKEIFSNFAIMESLAFQQGHSLVNNQVTLMLDGTEFPLSRLYRCNGVWSTKPHDEILESHVDKIYDIGYFVYKDSDVVKKDKGFKEYKLKTLSMAIKNVVREMATYPYYDLTMEDDHRGNLTISLRNSTAQIHICTVDTIIRWNEFRKSLSSNDRKVRCLPFDKNKDKYGTLYVFCTMDILESDCVINRIYTILTQIIDLAAGGLQNQDSSSDTKSLEIRYVPLEFKGHIIFNREEEGIHDSFKTK